MDAYLGTKLILMFIFIIFKRSLFCSQENGLEGVGVQGEWLLHTAFSQGKVTRIIQTLTCLFQVTELKPAEEKGNILTHVTNWTRVMLASSRLVPELRLVALH